MQGAKLPVYTKEPTLQVIMKFTPFFQNTVSIISLHTAIVNGYNRNFNALLPFYGKYTVVLIFLIAAPNMLKRSN